MARRIVTAREQFAMLAPWLREAMPWYHVSPNKLPKGTELTPGGGESPYADMLYADPDNEWRGDSIWMTNSPEHARSWRDLMEGETGGSYPHLYEVEPHERPEQNVYGDYYDKPPEYSSSGATIKRRVKKREATPWRSKPGDSTFPVPTEDLLQHRQFNPAITTPEQMRDSLFTQPFDAEDEPYRNNFTNSWSSGGGSEGSNEEDIVDAFEKGHKLPPVEVVTNGAAATLSDGNHRTEVADMMGQGKLDSYIHYSPHNPDSFFQAPVDPNSELGKHIDNLVQNHPYEPVEGGPTTDFVFRKHPQTGRWQRGKITDSSPHFVDTPEYHEQMTKQVPHFKPSGLGTYFDVDWGKGPEITHERHLYARRYDLAAH